MRHLSCKDLRRAVCLPDQPPCAEQCISAQEPDAAEQTQQAEEVERAAGEHSLAYGDAVTQAAEDKALAHCSEH
jgi:hypothetical protein